MTRAITFDEERAAEAAKAAASLAKAKAVEADAAVAHAAALKAVQHFTALATEATRPLPTQERVKLAFATLRHRGFVAHMSDKTHEWQKHGDKPKLALESFWCYGEPWSVDPDGRRSYGTPTDLCIWFSGTAVQAESAVAVLEYYGCIASVDTGGHSITVAPRLARCEAYRGMGYSYDNPERKRKDCAPCDTSGLLPNPAYSQAAAEVTA